MGVAVIVCRRFDMESLDSSQRARFLANILSLATKRLFYANKLLFEVNQKISCESVLHIYIYIDSRIIPIEDRIMITRR